MWSKLREKKKMVTDKRQKKKNALKTGVSLSFTVQRGSGSESVVGGLSPCCQSRSTSDF